MTSNDYFGIDTPEGIEGRRLARLEAVSDPITVSRLTRLGVAPGWRCLEVGAGGGSIARWLADRVGPEGSVVATDLDMRFLAHADLGPVEVRRHDILTDPLETDAFDLVHARALLMNLPDPQLALRRLAAAVKPGGILFVEDADWSSLSSLDPTIESEFHRLSHAGFQALRAARISDGYFGRRLLGLVESIGFEHVEGDGIVRMGRGGADPWGQFQSMNLQLPIATSLVSKGIMTQADLDWLRATYANPEFSFLGFTLFGAWARKPA
ncbi:methyltransferase domain-containing protein [Pendulispora brunnea]|uniref:Methyltransferase domain-containing protein n=1 Tax=Pendulispora brunnea TaxID=2905690 RepID=A0ABZ2K510_9BACT